MFEPDELRTIIDAAGQPMKAIVLLAANCAFGATDIACLPKSAIDFETGWVEHARIKTGVPRRIPLWPETLEALQAALAVRPKPKAEADADLVFVTKYGHRWVKTNRNGTPADALGQEFAKLLKALGLKRPRVSFYAIRHGFQTIGEEVGETATRAIMGHVDASMSALYRERISDRRLRTVTDHVHDWLFGNGSK